MFILTALLKERYVKVSINNTRYIGARRPYKVVATVLDEVYGSPSERTEIDFTSTDDLTVIL